MSLFVAAIMRTLTFTVSVPPTRSNSRSCSTRSSFTCVLRLMSPISSRKSVPPSASSNRPFLRAVAPVNAPFSYPNSSDSISVSGSAAQLTFTNGFLARSEL
jgi:hypothetical protein